jgi:hypothetical protein
MESRAIEALPLLLDLADDYAGVRPQSVPCELLELDRPALETITATYPRVRQVLEEFYISRASTQEEAMRRSLEARRAT